MGHKGGNGGRGTFSLQYHRYNFMAYEDRLETNLLQLLVHPENSEWFSIIFVIVFEVNIVAKQKQAKLVAIFCIL